MALVGKRARVLSLLALLKAPQEAATPSLDQPPAKNREPTEALRGPPEARGTRPQDRPVANLAQQARLGLLYKSLKKPTGGLGLKSL